MLFCLPYDFQTEWSAFANGTGNFFTAALQKDYFPYVVQSAKQITIDTLTLYAASASGRDVVSWTANVDLGDLSTSLSSALGSASLSVPTDDTVLKKDSARQVFLVLHYHFGM